MTNLLFQGEYLTFVAILAALIMSLSLHEFGHALHGMFSAVNYPRFSGTSVPRDFVELQDAFDAMRLQSKDVREF